MSGIGGRLIDNPLNGEDTPSGQYLAPMRGVAAEVGAAD